MRSTLHRTTATLAALALVAMGVMLAAAPGAQADAPYAPADAAAIHPGVQMFTDGAQCTANFIFEGSGATYIGYAAHCAGAGGEATDTDGCVAPALAPGHPVEITGADRPGTLAYSSWHTMQSIGEQDPDTCLYNDFALVEIHPDDVASVNPSVPHWGGPVALGTDGTAPGSTVHSYGNSSLRLGIELLSPKTGLSLGTAGGWTHPTYTLTPGIPGDSGSGLLDADGRAVGVLSTLALAPLAGSNNYSDLAAALGYANAHGGLGEITLVAGDVAFDGAQLPLGLGL